MAIQLTPTLGFRNAALFAISNFRTRKIDGLSLISLGFDTSVGVLELSAALSLIHI